jgi:hypothetical protein
MWKRQPRLPVGGDDARLRSELIHKMTVAELGGHPLVGEQEIKARVVKPSGHRPRCPAKVCGDDGVNASKHLHDGDELLAGRVCNVCVGVLIPKGANSGLSTNNVTDAGATEKKHGSTPRSPA